MAHPVLNPLPPEFYAGRRPLWNLKRLKDRGFYVMLSLLMTLIVVAGFWPYAVQITRGEGAWPWIVHVHTAVFFGWMLLLLAQVMLVFLRKAAFHRRLGRFGIGYGLLLLVLGLAVSFAAPVLHVKAGEWTLDAAAGFIILPLGDMVLFASFFGAGITYRIRPDVHKRLMLLATMALLPAPVARIVESHPLVLLLVWLLPLLLAMGYDLRTRRRVHRIYLIGGLVLAVGFMRVFVMESDAWLRLGRALITAFIPGAATGG